MKKKKGISTALVIVACVLLLSAVVYAAILLFASDSETSQNTKGGFFRVKLSTGMEPTELVPGDSFATEPVVTNDATYEMYVFITVETPSVDSESIYEFTAGDEWTLIENTAERSVWAYASATSMTTLSLDEATTPLTTKMTMKEISNTAFVELDDINVTITGYGIGTENVSTTPSEAWTYCKQVGNIE